MKVIIIFGLYLVLFMIQCFCSQLNLTLIVLLHENLVIEEKYDNIFSLILNRD